VQPLVLASAVLALLMWEIKKYLFVVSKTDCLNPSLGLSCSMVVQISVDAFTGCCRGQVFRIETVGCLEGWMHCSCKILKKPTVI